MAKKSRTKARDASAELPEGAVGPRQPCPCGSGKRYKACHGAGDGAPTAYVARPFEGLPSEPDVIALRELVPAATAPLTLKGSDRTVLLASLLPMAAPAMVRDSGDIWLGLQVQHNYGDPARDLGAVLTAALEAEAGVVGLTSPPGDGPRLQDLVEGDSLDITVHDGFDFWMADVEDDGSFASALEAANGAASPTAKLAQVPAAYWTDVGTKEHLRWVMPEPEDQLLDALSRLHAAGRDALVEGGAAGRDVPRARAPDPGLGPAARHRGGRARGPCLRLRGRARGGAGRRLTAHERAARRPFRSREPAGHDPLIGTVAR